MENSQSIGNRFDLLRLAAALAVFAAHGDFLYRLHLPVPFPGHSLGSLAVYVFFFISGYLVCESWMRAPMWRAFWLKRLMRIFPGLAAAVAFSVFVLGWAVTTLPSTEYWAARGTWINFLNNVMGLATVQTLPGVFESNPFARAVNGSLWTIRYELFMYLLLASLAWFARGRLWIYPLSAFLLAIAWQLARSGGWDEALAATGGPVAELFRWRDFCGFGVPFFLGSTMAAYGVRPRTWMAVIALGAVACALLVHSVLWRQVAVWTLIASGTLYVAFVGNPKAGSRWRADLSYGVYIYAFPVQQAVVELCLRRVWPLWVSLLLSLGLILALALLSWHCVERPCIQAAKRWLKRWPAIGGAQPRPAANS